MRWFLLTLGLCGLLVACGGDGGNPRGAASPGAPASASSTGSAAAAGSRTATATAATSVAAGGQSQATQEACRLVTKAEVEQATGLRVGEGRFTPGGLGGTCIYEQERAQPADLADRVYVQPFTNPRVYEELRAQASGALEVPGLGERAFASPLEVAVVKGSRGVYITWDHVTVTPGVTDAQRREQLITLARVAVGRW